MGWEDHVFEDPYESYERGLEEDTPDNRGFSHHERICTKCDFKFSVFYACACPECGGWTVRKGDRQS